MLFLADLLSLLQAQPLCPEKLALSPSSLSKTWKGHFRFHAGCQSLAIRDGGSLPGHLLERPKSPVSSPPRAVDAFLLSSGLSALGRFLQRLRPQCGAGGGCIPNSGRVALAASDSSSASAFQALSCKPVPKWTLQSGLGDVSLWGLFCRRGQQSGTSRALAVRQALGSPEIGLFILIVFIEHLLYASYTVLGVRQRGREVHGPALRELTRERGRNPAGR